MSNKFKVPNLTTGHKLNNNDALAFMLGGSAWFTLKSLNTGKDFSYGIVDSYNYEGHGLNRKKVANPDLKFVYLFIGANQAVQGKDYAYMGWIRKMNNGQWVYNFGQAKSKLDPNHPGEKAFSFVFHSFLNGTKLPTLEIWHQGICACCGKRLKLSESIELGWGPVCMKKRKEALENLHKLIETRKVNAQNVLASNPNRPDKTGLIEKVLPIHKSSGAPQGNLFSNLPDHSTSKR